MTPLRSLGNPDISPFDDIFAATGKRYNHTYPEGPSGLASVEFDGSDDYLTIPDNAAWDIGGDAFTIELFAYFDSHNSHDCLVHNLTDSGWSGGGWAFEYVSNKFDVYWYTTGYQNLQGNTVPTGSWRHHVWQMTSGGTHSIYQNGTRTNTGGSGVPRDGTNPLCIGGNCVGADFDGKISNLRITIGQALYSGASLTVPTSPLTRTSQGATASNVKLLCCNDPDDMLGSTISPGSITVGGGNPAVSSSHPF